MKKTFTLFAFVLCMATSYAQITINKSDMPIVGDTIRSSIFTGIDSLYGVNYTLTDTNYTWNFANIGWDRQKVDTFMSPPETAYASHFGDTSTCNLSTTISPSDLPIPGGLPVQPSVENGFAYFKVSSSKFEQVGMGATVEIPGYVPPTSTYSIFDTTDVFYKLPLAYNDKDTTRSFYLFSLTTGFGSVNIYESKTRINEVDGWGNITTPLGTFEAIRLKSTSNIKDRMVLIALGIDSVTNRVLVEYIWLTKQHHIPVMKITENINGLNVRYNVQYIDHYRIPSNWGLNENNEASILNIYPNPAKDFVRIAYNASKTANITIFDMYGNKVSERMIKGNSSVDIAVSDYAKGIYTARITEANSKPITKIFVVQ